MAHPIPRSLHQIWWSWHKDGSLSATDEGPPTTRYADAWRQTHADYAYTLWRHAPSFAFVAAQCAAWQAPFLAYLRHIQRCDMLRLLILQQHGGVYGDFDLVPHGHLDALWERYPQAGVVLSTEVILTAKQRMRTSSYPIRQGAAEHAVRVANYWLAARPHHPLLAHMLELMRARAHLPVKEQYDILYTTGPDIVSTVWHTYGHLYDDVVLLSAEESAAFFTHRAEGSWRF